MLTSARTDILGRYAKFSMGLRTSVCHEVRVLFNYISRDLQSITAKNIKLVRDTSGLDLWVSGSRQLKTAIHDNLTVATPPLDDWKVKYLMSLLNQLEEAKHSVQDNRMKDLQDLIDSLVL